MNNLIFFMALGGTIPFGIYLLLRYKVHLHYKYPTWMYRLLKLSIFFYLLPVPLLSNEIKNFLKFLPDDNRFFSLKRPENVEVPLNMGKYIQKLSNGRMVFPQYKMIFLIAGIIWFCVTIGLFVIYYRNYNVQRKRILVNSIQPGSELLEHCENVRKELSLKRHIRIQVMDSDFTPFTLGFLKPIVVFPVGYPPENIRLVLMHEYIHIKKCDALIQILGNIVIIIHWYLLFPYLLSRELNSMAELDCDYKVSCLLNESQIKLYGHLIINSNETGRKTTDIKSPFISNFSNPSKNLTKERLIMLRNCSKKRISVLLAFMIFTTFSSVVSAAGYQEPAAIACSDDIISDNDSFTAGEFKLEIPEDELLFSEISSYFITHNGIVIAPDTSSITPRSCSHSFVTGVQKRHVSHAGGSCTVYTYNAKKCSICGYIEVGTLITSVKYEVCPH